MAQCFGRTTREPDYHDQRLGRFFQEAGRPATGAPQPPPTSEELARFAAISAKYGYWNATGRERGGRHYDELLAGLESSSTMVRTVLIGSFRNVGSVEASGERTRPRVQLPASRRKTLFCETPNTTRGTRMLPRPTPKPWPRNALFGNDL
jgi:hypothetical protein